jgi:hypothetical protein
MTAATHYARCWPGNRTISGFGRRIQPGGAAVYRAKRNLKRRGCLGAGTGTQQGLEVEPDEQLLQLLDEQRVRLAQSPRRRPEAAKPAPVNPVKRLWNNLFD